MALGVETAHAIADGEELVRRRLAEKLVSLSIDHVQLRRVLLLIRQVDRGSV